METSELIYLVLVSIIVERVELKLIEPIISQIRFFSSYGISTSSLVLISPT